MDEETIKTPIPKCRYCTSVFVWGGVTNLPVMNLVRKRVLNSCRIWSTTQLNTATATHCLYILDVYFWKEGGGGRAGDVREKVEGQQFTRGVENTNRGRKYQHD
jgi:hypothetical protein